MIRTALLPGAPAPNFTLPAFAPLTGDAQGDVRLSGLQGRPVLLVFLRWLG
ncbi:MAG: hypothetical protein M3442_01315 [Chloroflexota bacterium]|nr:hypothetical protein [Chloroflexota bacterium]